LFRFELKLFFVCFEDTLPPTTVRRVPLVAPSGCAIQEATIPEGDPAVLPGFGGRLTGRQAAASEDQEVSVHQPSVTAICGDDKILKINNE
jgi:hypothetical protein